MSTKVNAQYSYSDYLEESNVDRKSEIGLYLWNEYVRGDLDSLKILAVNLILDAAEFEDPFMRSIGQRCLGSYYLRVGKSGESIEHLVDAKNYFELAENFELISETHNELGNAYLVAGDGEKAIKSYLMSMKMGEQSQDPTAAFNGRYGLGKAYYMVKDTMLAIHNLSEYKHEAVKLMKFEAAADAYAYLGMIELGRGNIGLAEEYYGKSVFFSKRSNSKVHLSHAYTNKAILFFNVGNTDSTEFYFMKSLKLRQELNRPKETAESYFNLGSYYIEIEDYKKAKGCIQKSIDLCKKHDLYMDEIDGHEVMLEILEKFKDEATKSKSEQRIVFLKEVLEKEKILNDEIILYAENSIDKLKEDKKLAGRTNKPDYLIWVLSLGFLIVLIISFWKLKWMKY